VVTVTGSCRPHVLLLGLLLGLLPGVALGGEPAPPKQRNGDIISQYSCLTPNHDPKSSTPCLPVGAEEGPDREFSFPRSPTFATRLAQQGVDLYTIQRLLGHKSPIMTQRYAHHSPESLRWAVDRLSVTNQSQSGKIVAASAV
jgi:hypothetical protein